MKNPLAVYCRNREFRQTLINSRGRLYRIAFSWCHDHHLSDDLVQETMAKALKHAKQLRDKSAVQSWLFGIMNNCWRDHLRRQKDMDNIDDVILHSEDAPDADFERQDVKKLIRKHMEQLNIGQRQVISLIDLQGFAYEEVSKILDIPIGTVMSRLSRARKQLADSLLESMPAQDKKSHNNKTLRRVI